jgi:hypothetical protein
MDPRHGSLIAPTDQPANVSSSGHRYSDVDLNDLGRDGRFPGKYVIAAALPKPEIQANTNLSIATAHDDEEDRMTFQSHNPATGEPIGTYPEHDKAEWVGPIFSEQPWNLPVHA